MRSFREAVKFLEMKNMESKKILIKKYENRRLYDVTNSRYVNLDEIARAIQNGHDLQVVDAATGEDLTRLVLTQIVIEQAKAPDSVFPLDILREMIVASGKASQESARIYMSALTDMYRAMLPQTTAALSPMEMLQNMMRQAAQRAPGASPQAPQPEPAAPRSARNDSAQVAELQRRIEELEQMVSRLAPKRTAKETTRKKSRR
jgi:polyhydroxyalkanoate synthesis repressor PhaR